MIEEFRKAIGRRFREARKALGLTQVDLSDALGLYQSSITRIEMGAGFPSLRICRYLRENHHISMNWLINGEGEMIIKSSIDDIKEAAAGFGVYTEDVEDMLFHMIHIASVRYEMLKHFQLYKIEHKESILDHLKKHNIEKK